MVSVGVGAGGWLEVGVSVGVDVGDGLGIGDSVSEEFVAATVSAVTGVCPAVAIVVPNEPNAADWVSSSKEPSQALLTNSNNINRVIFIRKRMG